MKAKTNHHHGNLREALILAGLAILEEDGLSALSLRKVAQRAGVSHAAPAHHFDGKHGLLVAIATRGFQTFTKYMRDEQFRDGEEPRAQLLGISNGYLKFAREHNALFRLIFTTEYKENIDAALQEASAEAYAVLAEVCANFEPSPAGSGVNELKVWAAVHGYAELRAFTRSTDPVTGKPIDFADILPNLTPRKP